MSRIEQLVRTPRGALRRRRPLSRNSNFAVQPFLLAAALLAPGAATADEVDDYVQSEMRRQNIPGIAVAVIKDGKVVKVKGYGLANVELGVSVTPDTVFPLQSITKTFTASAVMLLVEDKKLTLADKIPSYLAESPRDWNEITIRHLLSHTSGIKDHLGLDADRGAPAFDQRRDASPRDIQHHVAKLPLNFQPGTECRYSNAGYVLLGLIIEHVSGKPYATFLDERIFRPAGMTSTHMNDLAKLVPHRASGYSWADGKLRNGSFVSTGNLAMADGGVVSTLADMVKWDATLDGDQLLKTSSRSAMWTPAKLNDGRTASVQTWPYGLGWYCYTESGHRLIEHSGHRVTGFTSNFVRFPDDRLSVIVLTNQERADASAVAHGVARHFLPAGRR